MYDSSWWTGQQGRRSGGSGMMFIYPSFCIYISKPGLSQSLMITYIFFTLDPLLVLVVDVDSGLTCPLIRIGFPCAWVYLFVHQQSPVHVYEYESQNRPPRYKSTPCVHFSASLSVCLMDGRVYRASLGFIVTAVSRIARLACAVSASAREMFVW